MSGIIFPDAELLEQALSGRSSTSHFRSTPQPSVQSLSAAFETIRGFLSNRPLRRKSAVAPRRLTQSDLLQQADQRRPPPEWYESSEDNPF